MAMPLQSSAPPASISNVSPRPIGLGPTLPDKRVTRVNIEDAYVNFILHCNPAVSLETDTSVLREAFRTPPKSDGKTFDSFTLFSLIKQLEDKEIKTWAELAIKLGVTPPDQNKNQSSQKIQQYAVRLKRWMHSMHVDAFFDYLLNNPHPYWTEIPTDPNPVCEEGRDGVAAEDDMALRALLPQIRPRRGRRKPEDDGLNKSPSQRPRLESPTFNAETRRPDGLEAWTAHPDGRNSFLYPPTPVDSTKSAQSAFPWQSELTGYSHSAVTPVNGQAFWADPTEPRSAIMPSKTKMLNRRYGAKAVSSAWRSGGAASSGKTRGRPPINRVNESPLSAFPYTSRDFQLPSVDDKTPQSITTPVPMFTPEQAPVPVPIPPPPPPPPPQPARPTRPGRLSLRVPERVGGAVRLATPPPPVVVVNGENPPNEAVGNQMPEANKTGNTTTRSPTIDFMNRGRDLTLKSKAVSGQTVLQSDDDDTTNMEEIEVFFVAELLSCNWFDAAGNKTPPCGVDEAVALSRTMVENLSKQALTPEAFLINLSALAGGQIMKKKKACITRVEVGPMTTKYQCKWELQYRSLKGSFSLMETVPHSMWKKTKKSDTDSADEEEEEDDTDQSEFSAEFWKKKYQELVRAGEAKDQQANHLRIKVLEFLRGDGTPGQS